jgi:maltooligosyltrehalose trehalohydrolase
MYRGLVRVFCNLGEEPAELENPGGFILSLGSRDDIEVAEDKVRLPPDSIAILSADKS